MSKCNLVLVTWNDEPQTTVDLNRIAECVNRGDSGVRAIVVTHHKLDQLRLLPLWAQPTLCLSIPDISRRKLLPGRFVTGIRLHKHGEYTLLDAAGIPVPKWTLITPGLRLDPKEWGPYVVEKPSAGRLGAMVRIKRTGRIRYSPPESFPEGDAGRRAPIIAQRFVYTGEWPTSYRVITIFGETILSYRQVTRSRGAPLAGRWAFEGGGISVVSNTRQMQVELTDDAEIIGLAERAHREAFRNFPVLAFDLIRDAETGELFVLECHAHGTWLFSAEMGRAIEEANGIDFAAQYGLIEKTARVLARETPRLAEIRLPSRDDRMDRLARENPVLRTGLAA